VFLLPTLSLEGGIAATQDRIAAVGDLDPSDDAKVQAATDLLTRKWFTTFLRYGAVGWNLVDEDGPRPFDVNVLLSDFSFGMAVADKANDLYSPVLLAPFQVAPQARSPNGRTAATTSRRRRRTPSPSGPSSPARMAASEP
jgi:hypothetical protein